jgi:hypothetical protein
MITTRNVYFAGTALITTAAAISGGFEAALWVSGGALVFYAFCLALAEAAKSI